MSKHFKRSANIPCESPVHRLGVVVATYCQSKLGANAILAVSMCGFLDSSKRVKTISVKTKDPIGSRWTGMKNWGRTHIMLQGDPNHRTLLGSRTLGVWFGSSEFLQLANVFQIKGAQESSLLFVRPKLGKISKIYLPNNFSSHVQGSVPCWCGGLRFRTQECLIVGNSVSVDWYMYSRRNMYITKHVWPVSLAQIHMRPSTLWIHWRAKGNQVRCDKLKNDVRTCFIPLLDYLWLLIKHCGTLNHQHRQWLEWVHNWTVWNLNKMFLH